MKRETFHINQRLLRLLGGILLVAILVVSVTSLQGLLRDSITQLQHLIALYPLSGALAFVGLAGVSSLLSMFSSMPLVPFATAVWGPPVTITLLLTGWLLGASAAYGLARSTSGVLKHIISPASLDMYRARLDKKATFWVVVLFRLVMPAEVAGYVLGFLRYNFLSYLLATLIAEVPTAVVSVYASDAFLQAQTTRFLAIVVGAGLVTSILFHWFHKHIDLSPGS